jgi:hypothetical protein
MINFVGLDFSYNEYSKDFIGQFDFQLGYNDMNEDI